MRPRRAATFVARPPNAGIRQHMTSNPYAPPTAPVSDVQSPQPSKERPPEIGRACTLLWCSLGLAIPSVIVRSMVISQPYPLIGGVFAIFIGALMTLWFTAKLKRGRNWMRLLVTILTVLGILFLPFSWYISRQFFLAGYAGHPVLVAIGITLSLAQYVLNLIAVVFLNSRVARAWFLQPVVERSSAA